MNLDRQQRHKCALLPTELEFKNTILSCHTVPCSDTGPWLLLYRDPVALKTLRALAAATHTELILSDT